jgi:class 3 adenylate cyclase
VAEAISAGDKRRQARAAWVAVFCDPVGSTAPSACLDPEDLREVIGSYHRAVAQTVGRRAGWKKCAGCANFTPPFRGIEI